MNEDAALVTVELFGIPRLRAGAAQLRVPPGTLRQVLHAVEQQLPRLGELIHHDQLSPHYLASLNGVVFLDDLDLDLNPGSTLLLLSADAGG